MKYNRFGDIPQFTQSGSYEVNYPIHHLPGFIKEMQEEMNLQLNPDFQRGYVWTEDQQIAYLEFFFKGGKTGRILYFNCPSWRMSSRLIDNYNDFVCVDGLQRLTAAMRFINNEIKVFGSFYSEYQDKPSIGDNDFRVNINDLKTKREVLQWYLEMNTGGTVHTNEEIERVKKLMEGLN